MTIENDNFPLVATVNTNATDLRSFINEKRNKIVEIIILPKVVS